MDIAKLTNLFIEKYGDSKAPIEKYFSPGRVNLIGEHTDYNGGHVFPCALDFGTYLLVRKSQEHSLKFASTNFDFTETVQLTDLAQKHGDAWINYPLGVMNQFAALGIEISGLEMLYSGNIPNGAGLSSSASIEVVTAFALNDLYGCGINMIELVKLSQRAENQFVGVNCGIMDQFAVGMGAKDKAIFLDCNTLDYELVPINLNGHKLVIANTNKRRGLADSKYNERRSQCENAVELINAVHPIHTLGEIDNDTFEGVKHAISDETVVRRARHAVAENQRTIQAVSALKSGDLTLFGKLMNDSHHSLQYDYEVTGFELDTLVEEAQKIDGVIGSRMTGAGFGGCTVSIVKESEIDTFIEKVGKAYHEKTGLTAEFYVAGIGAGARKL